MINILKQIIIMALGFLLLTNCSSTQAPSQATALEAKFQTAQQAASSAQSGAAQVQSAMGEVEKLKQASSSSNATIQGNAPPPDESSLPQYGNCFDRFFGKVIRVTNQVDENANQNFPIVVNLVYPKDPVAYSILKLITAKDWFRRDNVNVEALKKQKKLLEIREIVLLPIQRVSFSLVRSPADSKAGFIFVRLVGNESLYATVFDPYEDINFKFNSSNFAFQQASDDNKG